MKYRLVSFLCMILMSSSIHAQNLPNNAAYKAYKDSLLRVYVSLMQDRDKYAAEEVQALMDRNQEERQKLEQQYALVFEDAFPYYLQRELFTKDSLSLLLNSASAEIRRSKVGKALNKYIKHQQITEGMRFQAFRCYDAEGKRFNWNRIKGKKVFLIHDGLWCMTRGTDNSAFQEYLHHLVENAPNCFPLIVVNCENREELLATIEKYGLQDFCVVSEFNKTFGTLNWLYNDIVTPTCHFIDEQGILVKTTKGIDTDYVEQLLL